MRNTSSALCLLATLGLLSISGSGASPASAQTPAGGPAAPMPDMDAGGRNVPPRTHVVSERANQVRMSAILGKTLYGPDEQKLGSIDDAFIDPRHQRLGLLAISGRRMVDWRSVRFVPTPSPRYVTSLRPGDIEGSSKKQELASYVGLHKDLFGKPAVGKEGQDLGTARDLIVTFGDGAIVGLGVSDHAVIGQSVHIVPWKFVRSPERNAKHVALNINKRQFAQEPVLTSKAPESATLDSAGGIPTKGATKEDPFVQAPNSRRE